MTYRIELTKPAASVEQACLVYLSISKTISECLENISEFAKRIAEGESPTLLTSELLRLRGVLSSTVEFPSKEHAERLLAAEPGARILAIFKASTKAQNACLGLIAVVINTVFQDAGQVAVLGTMAGSEAKKVLMGAHLAYGEIKTLMSRAAEIALRSGDSEAYELIYSVIDSYVLERLAIQRKEFEQHGAAGLHAIGILEGMVTARSKLGK